MRAAFQEGITYNFTITITITYNFTITITITIEDHFEGNRDPIKTQFYPK